MEYVHAALILHELGKPIEEETIKKIIEAAGVKADEAKVKALLAALSEINIDEALKTATVGFAVPAEAAATAPSEAPKKEEEKKEKKEAEEEMESGLSALFG